MKAIILAAGKGSRLNKYTRYLPKGMLNLKGKSLLAWQVEKYRQAGIEDIAIVTGYMHDKIKLPGMKYFHNPEYNITNMIESLMCAVDANNTDDLLISYSDIVFSEETLQNLIRCKGDIVVAADSNWRDYWYKRYGSIETDLESFSVDSQRKVIELGAPLSSSEQLGLRYIGLNKLSSKAMQTGITLYQDKKKTLSNWLPSGQSFYQGYFTDFIQSLIKLGLDVHASVTKGGWLEFDTAKDYEMVCDLEQKNQLKDLISL